MKCTAAISKTPLDEFVNQFEDWLIREFRHAALISEMPRLTTDELCALAAPWMAEAYARVGTCGLCNLPPASACRLLMLLHYAFNTLERHSNLSGESFAGVLGSFQGAEDLLVGLRFAESGWFTSDRAAA